MQKLDNKNRLTIPKIYFDTGGIDFSKNVGLFLLGSEMFIGNFNMDNSRYHCLGNISVDKSRRFVVPKLAREVLHLKPNDTFICYFYFGKTTFLKAKYHPPHR